MKSDTLTHALRLAMQYEPRMAARRDDPDTSHAAAESMQGTAGSQQAAILRVLRNTGRPMAAEEIGDVLGYGVWRRMCELKHTGHIIRSDLMHTNRSGRQAHKYYTSQINHRGP